jgi:hypothetical protein
LYSASVKQMLHPTITAAMRGDEIFIAGQKEKEVTGF